MAAAGGIAASHGVTAITLDKVARIAGVSKGALLHHFPCRQVLVEALCADMFEKWDEEILRLMAEDLAPEGRFTRAYILSSTSMTTGPFDKRLVGGLTMAMNVDSALRGQWNTWLHGRLSAPGGNETTLARTMARAAADGLWLADYTGVGAPAGNRAEIITALLEMTM